MWVVFFPFYASDPPPPPPEHFVKFILDLNVPYTLKFCTIILRDAVIQSSHCSTPSVGYSAKRTACFRSLDTGNV